MRAEASPVTGSGPSGPRAASTSRAARAAARLATSESGAEDTPSHTTSAANARSAVADGLAARAIASSLRECRTPRSHTPATQLAGRSAQWSRSDAAGSPHSVQYPSSATRPPQRTQGRAPLSVPSPSVSAEASPDGSVVPAAVPSSDPGPPSPVPAAAGSVAASVVRSAAAPVPASEPVAVGSGASGVPHASQNRAPSGDGSPHAGHASTPLGSATVPPGTGAGAGAGESLIGSSTGAPRSRGPRA